MFSEKQVLLGAPQLLTGDGLERMSGSAREQLCSSVHAVVCSLGWGWSNVIFENWSQTVSFS